MSAILFGSISPIKVRIFSMISIRLVDRLDFDELQKFLERN
jgi:hypothetical protein